MTEESRIDRAFEDHDAFEPRDGEFAATTTPFEATATATAGPAVEVEVEVRLPTIDAAVAGEVGDAVAEGWYETLSLRLEDAYDVARYAAGEIDVGRAGETVVVTLSFEVERPERGVDDAAAVVDYVEGTYVQGVIPGYEYEDPVAGLLAEARQNAQGGPGGV